MGDVGTSPDDDKDDMVVLVLTLTFKTVIINITQTKQTIYIFDDDDDDDDSVDGVMLLLPPYDVTVTDGYLLICISGRFLLFLMLLLLQPGDTYHGRRLT